jgi:hypothetical protein
MGALFGEINEMFARRAKESHRDTVTYEIEMLRFCVQRLVAGKHSEVEDQYVYLEGFLLHYRNLVRFFSGEYHNEAKGDLSTANPQKWANREITTEEVSAITNPAKALDAKYHKYISKYLQHCTDVRSDHDRDWDVRLMFEEMSSIISAFEHAFPR